jgi:3-phenylpropionate/trans-cinnamate dioxygenase ferredoxin subunit
MSSQVKWYRVGSVEEIQEEEMLTLVVDDRHILVYDVDGAFYATDGLCTHEQAPLIDGYLDEEIIECPKHNARFHVCTGKALRRPAREDLKTYAVKVEASELFVGIDA